MKKLVCGLLSIIGSVYATDTTSHDVILGVEPINEIEVGRETSYLIVHRDAENPNEAVDIDLNYNVTTNETGKKIIAFLNDEVPQGTHLYVKLDPPAHASPLGEVELSIAAYDVVRGINKQTADNLEISYRYVCEPDVNEVSPTTRIVTYILTDM